MVMFADELTAMIRDFEQALDPVAMAQAAGLDPDPWQASVLRSGTKRKLLNASRQSGKSTVIALKNVHRALVVPKSLCLMLSPSQRQSGELFKKAAGLFRDLGRPVGTESETALTVTFNNGSRIVSLPGTEGTVRGYSGAALISVDEASRVSDALYYSVRPMLAVSDGELVAMSTPFGSRGWWYQAWVSSQTWERYEVPADKCPRISPEFLAEELESMGQWWYDQEYGCKFLDAQSSAFTRDDIDAAFGEEVEAWEL